MGRSESEDAVLLLLVSLPTCKSLLLVRPSWHCVRAAVDGATVFRATVPWAVSGVAVTTRKFFLPNRPPGRSCSIGTSSPNATSFLLASFMQFTPYPVEAASDFSEGQASLLLPT